MNDLKLTPLEDHLYQIIHGTSPEFLEDNKMYNSITIDRINAIKECASVCMKWMEKLHSETIINWMEDPSEHKTMSGRFQKWLRDSGLTPTEPDTKELTGELKDEGNYTVGSNGITSVMTPFGDFREEQAK